MYALVSGIELGGRSQPQSIGSARPHSGASTKREKERERDGPRRGEEKTRPLRLKHDRVICILFKMFVS